MYLRFQFYNSTIKTESALGLLFTVLEFQFYNSTIKTSFCCHPSILCRNFNSTIVRLKRKVQETYRPRKFYFNSTIVRLKQKQDLFTLYHT